MELEVLEPYSFHSAKVIEMLLLATYFTQVAYNWHRHTQETSTKKPVHSFLKP